MKIAILKLSAMGDIIQSAFILQFLKSLIEDIEIDWIVEESFAPILENNPDIRNIKRVDLKSIKKSPLNIFKEIKKLREYSKERYDIVVDMQGLIKSSIAGRIISKNLYGYDKDSARESIASIFYKKSFSIAYDINTMDRYRLLINRVFNVDITKNMIMNKKPYLYYLYNSHKHLSSSKKNIMFIIGASWDSKIYPKRHVADLVSKIDANIIIPYSNQKELEFVSDIKGVKAVKLDLDELKSLISSVDLVIGNDTGPTYIAWANNIPSITLYGPVPPTRVYETKINRFLKSPSKVDPYKLDRDDFSIKDIKKDDILRLYKELTDICK
jgi:heptosyltransferase-1